ncbi:DUF2264 domain-containing protein [Niabella drilacis]|uniref:DUF2264 domain-containing protein n=1 Tax=Niabella drilacis (strain DSM 25811 / CCM 8410 / CCUG 62505 / LMG 26954 / E90) TaxID=1285928 RepID=A0A1G6J9J2_NIADE|nr:DUF2264 domain-containing protein [Niabella drilacis]SDC15283.1 hypothetical protein SAMN04487894_101462 [Niabella drilacis]
MKIRKFTVLAMFCFAAGSAFSQEAKDVDSRRMQWVQLLDKVVRPVFTNMAADQLRKNMPKEISPVSDNPEVRIKAQYLEALGRAFSGIAPWLNGEGGPAAEKKLRDQYRALVIASIRNATDSTKNDYVLWKGAQPLVDASFFALGLVRAPWIWEHLGSKTQQDVVYCLNQTRRTVPGYNNWILFSGMIEAFFLKYGYDYNPMTIEYGVRTFMYQWYTGDGLFSDGEHFHNDYYNSYVIQPYLREILDIVWQKTGRYRQEREQLLKINDRYSEIQERTINADGSFPAYGRSIVYRSGAFHHLANMAYKAQLPASLAPSQVREALFAVLQKTLVSPATYDKNGWMVIGLNGKQPGLADTYNNQGSLYLCTEALLPLGLAPDTPFWKDAPRPWSSKAIWNGADFHGDHAIDLK